MDITPPETTGPTVRKWNDEGILIVEEYYKYGVLHREDGPAQLFWNDDGVLVSKAYYIKGKIHRKDGTYS